MAGSTPDTGGSSTARLADARRIVLASGLGLCLVLPADAGLIVLTHETNDSIAADLVVVRLEGTIAAPMAKDLAAIWTQRGPGHRRLLVDLDSGGGALQETVALIDVLKRIRKTAAVDTLVRHDALCASACIAIFMQGQKRHAGGSSTWLFHGASHSRTNVPNLAHTDRYLDLLREAGVTDDFLCLLVGEGYVTTPGKLWLSGYELVHVFRANVINDLLKPWRPEPPRRPYTGIIGPH